jgi:F0F1-type ATP synthase beta subunit
MTNREKRKHRRIWRKEKQELRKRKKNVLITETGIKLVPLSLPLC